MAIEMMTIMAAITADVLSRNRFNACAKKRGPRTVAYMFSVMEIADMELAGYLIFICRWGSVGWVATCESDALRPAADRRCKALDRIIKCYFEHCLRSKNAFSL